MDYMSRGVPCRHLISPGHGGLIPQSLSGCPDFRMLLTHCGIGKKGREGTGEEHVAGAI